MTFVVVVTEQAARDIVQDAEWWARERSPEEASRWYVGIRNAIAGLRDKPARCARAAEQEQFPYELRSMPFGLASRPTHRVLFTILKQTVLVLAIRHTAQDGLQPETPA